MIKYFIVFVCMLYSTNVFCQTNNPLKPSQVGFSFNMGAEVYDFSKFNEEMEQYDFIGIQPECMSAKLEVHIGSPIFMNSIYVSRFVNLLDDFENQKYMNFHGYKIGMRFMRNLYGRKSFRSRFYIGANASFINLSFVDGTSSGVKGQSLNQLMGNSALINLTPSSYDNNLQGGITLELLPRWFIKNKPHRSEFLNFVLDMGYTFNIKRERNWVISGVRTPNRISNVPALNTNHLYMFLTYRFMFDTIFNPKSE